jgi:hypothetical protein
VLKDSPQLQKLEACVQRISGSGDLPAFANDIYELMTTVADKEASLSRPANIILRNVSLTTKLLRLDRHIENAMASILPAATALAETPLKSEGTIQEEHFSDLSREVELVLDSAADYPLNDLIMMILEAIFRGGQCDRVLFCLLEEDRSHVQGRMGIGEAAEDLMVNFRFPVSLLSGPVGSAVVGKKM